MFGKELERFCLEAIALLGVDGRGQVRDEAAYIEYIKRRISLTPSVKDFDVWHEGGSWRCEVVLEQDGDLTYTTIIIPLQVSVSVRGVTGYNLSSPRLRERWTTALVESVKRRRYENLCSELLEVMAELGIGPEDLLDHLFTRVL